MLSKVKGIHKTKSGFLTLLTATVGLFLYFLYNTQRFPVFINEIFDDLQYFPDSAPGFSETVFDKNFEKCFSEPFAVNEDYLKTSLKKFSNFSGYENFTESAAEIKTSPLSSALLLEFADLMSALDIETVLLEPSLLFCMLSPPHKDLLMRRNFRPHVRSTVTFGMGEKDVPLLRKADVQVQVKLAGFSIELIHEPLAGWMIASESNTHFTSHVFFTKDTLTVHVVVLYRRGFYLWHAALKKLNYENIPPMEELSLAEENSAYDSITSVSVEFENGTRISIPSRPHHFLLEMATSKFLECNSSIVEKFKHSPSDSDRSLAAQQRFERRTVVALRELKARLDPLLIRFWIWSGTLLGWYRQCSVIPYTSDVDFAAWATEVDDLDQIVKLFIENKHLKLRERMGLVQEALELNLNCHNVRVDLFFLYAQSNGTWYAGHRPSKGYYFKYHHPPFTLCSAELLEHKVLVPCEAEDVISAEYGPDWLKPVTSWNYESSIKNRGPNIYWDKSILKSVYSG